MPELDIVRNIALAYAIGVTDVQADTDHLDKIEGDISFVQMQPCSGCGAGNVSDSGEKRKNAISNSDQLDQRGR